MGGYQNPLTGSGWDTGGQPPQNNILGGANPINLQGPPGNVLGGGSNLSQGNPGGWGNPRSQSSLSGNVLLENIISGQMRNQLAPQFAKLMGQYGGDAGKFYEQLMNYGSPFYKQKQAEGFTQGVGQNQNAAAMAKQQLGAQGYGAGPSGANAAMIGGMNQMGSQNLAEQYLQQLFQNEQMQMGGAQGLSSLASLFNPTQLLSANSTGNVGQSPTFADSFGQIAGGIGSMFGGAGQIKGIGK